MTELWLIRHGQTDWNVQGRYQGQSDVPLNPTGEAQAVQLAARLGGQHFDAIYASDLSRAHRTAQILGQQLGLPVQSDPHLREICQGEWEGQLLTDVRARTTEDPDLLDPSAARAPGGESVNEVAARMAQAADQIAHTRPNGRVLVVSHGLAVAALICLARRLPLKQVYEHIPDNAQPTVVQWCVDEN